MGAGQGKNKRTLSGPSRTRVLNNSELKYARKLFARIKDLKRLMPSTEQDLSLAELTEITNLVEDIEKTDKILAPLINNYKITRRERFHCPECKTEIYAELEQSIIDCMRCAYLLTPGEGELFPHYLVAELKEEDLDALLAAYQKTIRPYPEQAAGFDILS